MGLRSNDLIERKGGVKRYMPADLFSAIADPTRRRILEMLADHDGYPASDIHNQFQSSPQAISQHLKILREANLVHVEKKAQQRIYRINTESMVELEEWIYNMRQRWSSRLDALDAVLKAEMEKLKNNHKE
ncbi:metalloregulator ArsR/SmtB family transcription factor [Paenibacillus sp. 1011MAR3C5]|uniref:ArsR/SmtB family transcription factor n=1 Tax=Paenibacillus sp. 1011MAR3C5 TaxID=1675787 RepID=UPI002873C7D8|nr:metalloregulator ArsR/SmtB family transcription factor [Paenibacillus sp. 1011MAR3C5]